MLGVFWFNPPGRGRTSNLTVSTNACWWWCKSANIYSRALCHCSWSSQFELQGVLLIRI